ncbi:MAG: FAD-binding oxidoreductase [Armatimonadetes bacterium]|nr:FAD-binding oxidoreductase [Armatimonadota bacterium]
MSILQWDKQYEDFLHDESRLAGTANSISFPKTEAEVVEIVRAISSQGGFITIQGARTGIVAGAVPQGGHILNLSRMNEIGSVKRTKDGGTLAVQPGAILEEIRKVVEKESLFFPPDPTETTCSIGGMVSCNASGALSFHYGPTRKWVEAIRIVMSNGDIICLRRGECKAQGRSFSLTKESGRVIKGQLPTYSLPNVKSAAGYYVNENMDMLDLFIGMEGTLGVITEIELRLIPKPKAINGLTIFLPNEESAIKLVNVLRNSPIRPVAIEFFDANSLNLLRGIKSESSAFEKIPALKPHYHSAIYLEFHADNQDIIDEAVMQAMDAIIELGGTDEDTWYATNERELDHLKAFRHATPEAVNLLIDKRKKEYPELTKLGTDMSVPDERLEEAIAMYRAGVLEHELESVMFGHIGNNHIHVNILPHNKEDYERGRILYLSWAQQVVKWGGSVSAEHGIGKLKVPFLELMYGAKGIAEMRSLKAVFDPNCLFNPGNLFKWA